MIAFAAPNSIKWKPRQNFGKNSLNFHRKIKMKFLFWLFLTPFFLVFNQIEHSRSIAGPNSWKLWPGYNKKKYGSDSWNSGNVTFSCNFHSFVRYVGIGWWWCVCVLCERALSTTLNAFSLIKCNVCWCSLSFFSTIDSLAFISTSFLLASHSFLCTSKWKKKRKYLNLWRKMVERGSWLKEQKKICATKAIKGNMIWVVVEYNWWLTEVYIAGRRIKAIYIWEEQRHKATKRMETKIVQEKKSN